MFWFMRSWCEIDENQPKSKTLNLNFDDNALIKIFKLLKSFNYAPTSVHDHKSFTVKFEVSCYEFH